MNTRRIASSLITRIIIMGVLLMACGGIARYVVLSVHLREDLGAMAAAQQLALANYVAWDVNHKLLERQEMLQHAAAALPLALLQQPEQLRRWLDTRPALQAHFAQGILVTDTNGQVLARHATSAHARHWHLAGNDGLRAALTAAVAVGRPLRTPDDPVPVLPMAAPVQDASGTVRAILVGLTALGPTGFLNFPDMAQHGDGSQFLLVSPRDQLFIAASNPNLVLQATPAPGTDLLHDRAMQGYRGTGITANAQGAEDVSAIVAVPSTGWFVVARIPADIALATISRGQRYVIGVSLFIIGLFLLVGTIGLMYVFQPLLRAAAHADRMTQGEAPLEPLPVVRNDEVGHLTAAFNRLLLKLQASQSDLSHLAHHDPLTGLPNRALLADRLAQALMRASRQGAYVALLYIDLDRFKPINDQLGHAMGDVALRAIGVRLGAITRESDTLARIGGDEFVVLLGDIPGPAPQARAAACAVAAKCLQAIEPTLDLNGQHYSVGASIGIAVGSGLVSSDALQSAADSAMYQAKRDGGQNYCLAPDLAGHDQK